MITYLDGCDRRQDYENRMLARKEHPTRSDEELEEFFKELSSASCGALRVIAQRKLRQVRERLAGREES